MLFIVRMVVAAAAVFIAVSPLMAQDGDPQFGLILGAGASLKTWHGQSAFRSVTLERVSPSPLFSRYLGDAQLVAAFTYSKVHQPRSWFGHQYGDPDDRVRSEWMTLAVRRPFRMSSARLVPYVDIGTGPMWSNRRVPAATSRFNVNSQIGLGAILRPRSRYPLQVGYRFSHISNGGIASRNPGLNVNSLYFGAAIGRR